MELDEFKEIKVKIQRELEKALLAAEEKHPGGLQSWFKDLGEGPASEDQ